MTKKPAPAIHPPLTISSTNPATSCPRNQSRRRTALWFVAAICLAVVVNAPAQTPGYFWTGTAGDKVWSDANNWVGNILPAPTNDVFFTDAGASGTVGPTGTADNIVTSNTTINSLIFTLTNTVHTTLINPGVTLTLNAITTNPLTAGGETYPYALFAGSFLDVATYAGKSFVTINGPGATLAITNAGGAISVRQGHSLSTSSSAYINMTGLDTLQANVLSILAGGESTTVEDAGIYLAKTNFITLNSPSNSPALVIGCNTYSHSSPTATCFCYLGQSNVLYSDGGIAVPLHSQPGLLQFNSAFSNPTAYFRNTAGTGPQSVWYIGFNNNSSHAIACTGTVDFSLGTVDAMVGTMVVGEGMSTATAGGNGVGVLNFFGGKINVNTVQIGEMQPGNNAGLGQGTINVSSKNAVATMTINSNLYMGQNNINAALPTAVLNITNGGVVTVGGNILPGYGSGGQGTPGNTTINLINSTFSMSGTMGAASSSTGPLGTFLISNSTFTINLGFSPNPVSPVCTVSTFAGYTNSTLTILGGALSVGQFSVIQYSALANLGAQAFTTFTLPSAVLGYLSNNVANNSIDVVITNVFVPIWTGNINGNWDINATANWRTSTGAAVDYVQTTIPGNLVTFDDSATGTTTVNLTSTNLGPSSINVSNSTLNYTFSGSGALVGPGGLSKNGSAALLIANTGSNSFLGAVIIGGGLLQMGVSNGLPPSASVTLADVAGATFDLNSWSQTIGSLSGGGPDGGGNVTLGTGTLTIAGTGGDYNGIISGNGGLVVASNASEVLSQPSLYTGNTLISSGRLIVVNNSGSATGSGGVDIEGGNLQFGAGTISANGAVNGTITNNGTIDFDFAGNVTFANFIQGTGNVVQEGASQAGYTGGSVFSAGPGTVEINTANNYSGTNIIESGALYINNGSALGTGPIIINDTTGAELVIAANITLTNAITMASKTGARNGAAGIESYYGSNVVAGPIIAQADGSDQAFQSDSGGVLVVAGGTFVMTNGTSQSLFLRGQGTGIWGDSIQAGTNLIAVLVTDGGTWTIANSSINTYSAPTQVGNGTTLIVDGQLLASPVVITNNSFSVLAGSGLIGGPVSIQDYCSLTPGDANGNVLTISNSLTLGNSVVEFNLTNNNGALSYNRINGLTTVNYGDEATLVINLTGNLTGSEVFHLFNAASFSGAFAYYSLPALPGSLSWDTSHLTIDGTLRLNNGVDILSAQIVSGGLFQLTGSGTANTAGQLYRILATTNLATKVSNWVQVGSGTLSSTPFTFSDTNTPGFTQRFYILVSP